MEIWWKSDGFTHLMEIWWKSDGNLMEIWWKSNGYLMDLQIWWKYGGNDIEITISSPVCAQNRETAKYAKQWIRWKSDGNPMEIRWKSDGFPMVLSFRKSRKKSRTKTHFAQKSRTKTKTNALVYLLNHKGAAGWGGRRLRSKGAASETSSLRLVPAWGNYMTRRLTTIAPMLSTLPPCRHQPQTWRLRSNDLASKTPTALSPSFLSAVSKHLVIPLRDRPSSVRNGQYL